MKIKIIFILSLLFAAVSAQAMQSAKNDGADSPRPEAQKAEMKEEKISAENTAEQKAALPAETEQEEKNKAQTNATKITASSAGSNKEKVKTATAQEVLDGLISWDKKLNTLEASFKQETDFEGTPISSSEGKIYKQGKNIRLDTFDNGAVAQSAQTDKKIIKIFDENGDLIKTLPWDSWSEGQTNKTLFDFGNYEQVVKEHKLKDFKSGGQTYTLTLIPIESNEESYELSFKLDAADFFVKEISLENQGVRTKTMLKDVKKNIKFKESILK